MSAPGLAITRYGSCSGWMGSQGSVKLHARVSDGGVEVWKRGNMEVHTSLDDIRNERQMDLLPALARPAMRQSQPSGDATKQAIPVLETKL